MDCPKCGSMMQEMESMIPEYKDKLRCSCGNIIPKPPGVTIITNKWEVRMEEFLGYIKISGVKDGHYCDTGGYDSTPVGTWDVHSPNFIERLFGITWEMKVDKTKKKCQLWCDNRNRKDTIDGYKVKRAIGIIKTKSE
jgi:hypothetical protein